MSDSIIEQIAEQIKTTVAGVTEAAGYHQTLTAYRPKRKDWNDAAPLDNTALIWQEDDDPSEKAAMGTCEFTQDFMIIVNVLDSDTATASIDTRINAIKSDLRKAMMTDPTRGGLALDTIPGPGSKYDDGTWSGVAVTFSVTYRTVLEDPYTQA